MRSHLPLNLEESRHILVILDACYSGIALSPIVKWGRDGGAPLPYSALHARRSRIVITSALDDEIALDAGPVSGHSLFTGCLIQGLTGGLEASLVEQGRRLTTGSELGRYLRRRVLAFPDHLRLGSRQTPDFGSFDFDDRGEMLIPISVNEPIAVAPGAVESPRHVTQDATQPAPVSSPPVPEPPGERPPAAGDLAPQRTILGFPRERLCEPRVQRAILYLAGTMLLAAGISERPDNLPGGTFFEMFWLSSGAVYALLGVAPPGLRAKSGIPRLLAYVSLALAQWSQIAITHRLYADYHVSYEVSFWELLYGPGYSMLLIGLLARATRQSVRREGLWVGGGVVWLIPSWVAGTWRLFGLLAHLPILFGGTFLLGLVIMTLGVSCVVFVIPWSRWFPGARPFNSFALRVVAALVWWMPVQWGCLLLAAIVHGRGNYALAMLGQGLLPTLANLGVLLLPSPAAAAR